MHISEGVLTPEILAFGTAVSALALIYSYRKLSQDDIAIVSALSALFFIGSFIHIPVGPVSVHLVLNGLIGAIIGTRAFVAIFVALLLQGLLFGYGGITTLGINTLNLALPSLVGYWLILPQYNNVLLKQIAYFCVGFIPVALSAVMLSATLALNGEVFIEAAKIAFIAHIPIMIIEGIIAMFTLYFIEKTYPKYLRRGK
ncbi:MAG: cobalt transporter CbiM [Sulfurospirillaceae bacterium]|nr:cobalt transporter CbiM [Sulfurospirillaceae bacterium]